MIQPGAGAQHPSKGLPVRNPIKPQVRHDPVPDPKMTKGAKPHDRAPSFAQTE